MAETTDCTEALLARTAEGDAAALKELVDKYHSWIVQEIEARLRQDKRLDSREDAKSVAWDVEEELRNAVLKYARLGKPIRAKQEFTRLAARIVRDKMAQLARDLRRDAQRLVQGAEEEPSPDLADPKGEQRVADYLDTLSGKRKGVAHAVLLLNFTATQVAKKFGMSGGMARRYCRNVEKEFKLFLASGEVELSSARAGPAAESAASSSFRRATAEDLAVQPAPPSASGRAPGTELVPGVICLRRMGGDTTSEIWKVAAGGFLLALKIVPNAGKEVWCEVELLSEDARYHPHFVRGWAPGSLDGRVLFFMELADENLYAGLDRIRKAGGRGYTATHLLDDLSGVAAALDSLVHRRDQSKLVHGSVKPSNMLRFGTTVKLGGFGEVRYFRKESDPQGVPLLCPYAAPEAVKGWPSQRSDQYSLALTYYELRGGRRPSKVGEAPSDLSVLARGETEIIARALSSNPRERYQSCQRLLNELRKAIGIDAVKNVDDEVVGQVPKAESLRWCNLRRTLKLPEEDTLKFISFERRGTQAAAWFDDRGNLRQEECPKPLSKAHRESTMSGQTQKKSEPPAPTRPS